MLKTLFAGGEVNGREISGFERLVVCIFLVVSSIFTFVALFALFISIGGILAGILISCALQVLAQAIRKSILKIKSKMDSMVIFY